MPEIPVRNWSNETLRTLQLDAAVFDCPAKPYLVHEAVCAYRAGGRRGTHKTKNRVDVSGGTRKLWRQKGTGRARVGDNRSPLWRHGGTVHGPVPRDYSWRLPKGKRRGALRSVLSEKLRDGKLLCLEHLALSSHRTKELELALRRGLGIENKVLLLPLEDDRNLWLAARNNPGLHVVRALGVSVVDLLAHDTVIASEDALRRLGEVLAR
jgi:large subunit ribosomal protein L4